MFNAFNPVNRNYFASPGYKRGFQADSGSYAAQPSLNYQTALQAMPAGYGNLTQYGGQYGGQSFGASAPQYFGNPMYGGDQMLGQPVMPQFQGMRKMPYGRRVGRFVPYMEQVQPFAGMGE